MTFELANSWWMYLLGAFVCVFVLFTSVAFILKSCKKAKELGMDKTIIKKTVITSLLFSLLPSISILIGVIALSGTLGIPLPWIRLSVIGALHYEQTAVQAAYSGITMANMSQAQFVTIACVMTIFILSGPIFCLIFFKTYEKKVLSKAKVDSSKVESKKKPFSSYLFSAAFIALISSFLAEEIAKIANVGKLGTNEIVKGEEVTYTSLNTFTPIVVIVVSFGCMALFDLIAKKCKQKWLEDFALGFSMIIGMASAVLLEMIKW